MENRSISLLFEAGERVIIEQVEGHAERTRTHSRYVGSSRLGHHHIGVLAAAREVVVDEAKTNWARLVGQLADNPESKIHGPLCTTGFATSPYS